MVDEDVDWGDFQSYGQENDPNPNWGMAASPSPLKKAKIYDIRESPGELRGLLTQAMEFSPLRRFGGRVQVPKSPTLSRRVSLFFPFPVLSARFIRSRRPPLLWPGNGIFVVPSSRRTAAIRGQRHCFPQAKKGGLSPEIHSRLDQNR